MSGMSGIAEPAKGMGRQAQRSAEMRGRLCQAAIDALCEVGYDKLSTTMVSARADVSRGAQTHHFPTKTDLLIGAFQHLLHSWEEARQAAFGTTDPPSVSLETYLRFAWKEIFSRPSYVAALELMMAARMDPRLRDLLRSAMDSWVLHRSAVWREVLSFSGLREDEAFQHINLCMLRGLALHSSLSRGAVDSDVVLEQWIGIVRQLGAGPCRPGAAGP